ncbi:hypothetical protein T03_6444, partial [Trichinella britovi]
LRKDFSTPPTPKRRSDLADRAIVPCLVFTVADLITPSSLGWISMILPIGHLIHVVLGSCTSTMSPTLGSCFVLRHLPRVARVLSSQALLIPPSLYQVVHSTCDVIAPVDPGSHTR